MNNDERLGKVIEEARTIVPVGSVWRHFKGGVYTIETVCLDESTLLPAVVYRRGELTFSRPLHVWLENVVVDGQSVPRFRRES